MSTKDEITEKQELFCQEFMKDLNRTQAAIRAGYSVQTAAEQGSRLLSKAKIEERIQQLHKERAKRLGISVDWVLRGFVTIANRSMQATPVLDRKGNPTGMWKADNYVAMLCFEKIGKHLGMFVDRHEVAGKDGEPVHVQVYLPDNGRTDNGQ